MRKPAAVTVGMRADCRPAPHHIVQKTSSLCVMVRRISSGSFAFRRLDAEAAFEILRTHQSIVSHDPLIEATL